VAADASLARTPSGRSLMGTTLRRTLLIGWRYLAIAAGLTFLLSFVLVSVKNGAGFVIAFPLELPLFVTLGSVAGLLTFTSDRTKGVFEYLIAYGIRPRTLFLNGLLASAAMAALTLAISLPLGLGIATARGISLNEDFANALAYYTIPMGFAGGLFTSTVGMIWSSVSNPRTGLSSPVGIAPLVGIAPTILVQLVAEGVASNEYYYVTVGAAAAILLAVAGLIAVSSRIMGRERFLSPL
jgi:hypothetical protein